MALAELLRQVFHSGGKVQERKSNLSLPERQLWKMGWTKGFLTEILFYSFTATYSASEVFLYFPGDCLKFQ